MSGVLHPEGPEPAQTYWLRRAMVLLALLLLVLVSFGVAGASMGATRQQTQPPAAGTEPSDSPTPSSPAGPSASSSASTDSSDGVPRPSTSSSPTADKSAARGAGETTTACVRKDLVVAVQGKQMLKLSQPAAFKIGVRNDSDDTCQLRLARTDFELKITSGKKLIWSNRSCSTATFVVAAKLELDQTMGWSMLWDGRGVAAGCATPGPVLKRGTYLATVTVAGAKPAELPITLRP